MADIYLHGIETVEKDSGPRPVNTIDTGVIGLVGTAPDADDTLWPVDTPIAIHGINDVPEALGATGTLLDAINAIFDQATRVSQTIVLVRVEEGANLAATVGNIIGSPTARTGLHALRKAKTLLNLDPKLLIAPGFTGHRPTDGVASIAVTTQGDGYDEAPVVSFTGGGGFGAAAHAVIDATGKVTSIVVDNPGQGYAIAPTVVLTGGGFSTLAVATATLGAVANPVAVEMVILANILRACAIVDGPNSTTAAAVTYRLDFNSDRLLIVDPFVKIQKGASIVSEPASARIAGLQAQIDYAEGFWFSPSNHVIQGIVGAHRVVEHSLSDPSVESQFLNKNAVATIVRSPSGGFKLWGSRVPSSDSLKVFWSVRRAHDTIITSIELAHEPFIDKPFSLQVLTDIAETVNQALRKWKAMGATLGGRVWLDAGLNTKESWASGHLFVSYDAEGPAPIEHITFQFSRNTGYYEQLGQDAIREIARLSGRAI
ncbi:MAG: phage tail sheath subtilisin-like domain-containing protein [Devosia sp.]|uniref:phage tail sheath subtilisin-like domain-containing protein n=1 Tax=Devosia sp. TaxID=1871048 RepID=UPI001AC652D3|nr:phage tail sheath subtilisin-like domain-containing protein [Devosia sp.]MBN9308794.1 phage tail sheath subtilisin-like domain-containing protein [Devosia sp.]MBN9314253.1 phage tail sheath subtilisin-like domain-containing protein [Devosia sp.]